MSVIEWPAAPQDEPCERLRGPCLKQENVRCFHLKVLFPLITLTLYTKRWVFYAALDTGSKYFLGMTRGYYDHTCIKLPSYRPEGKFTNPRTIVHAPSYAWLWRH